ncbi:DUF3533 domain-containing protein [Kocuria sp. JC486]|uniref:ABC transporter permease n=1 Tax=Kocuria sp. JC486 TaxID=1970736 RepID=UPI001423FAED|nr:ABC transporter permease [Kocuria sp. JC486]NHU86231.1 DUF3533 domain-containing protein [Kocuria sp. JC486]
MPPLLVVFVGFLGILLYLGGLGSPADHMRDMPVAIVNQDEGATVENPDGSSTDQELGKEVTETLVKEVNDSGEFDLQEMSMADAHDALTSGDVYGAIVVPKDFSQRSMDLIPASIGGDGDGAQPTIELVTSPQAGSMSSRLVTEGFTPALESVSSNLGEQLTSGADQQVQARQKAGQKVPDVTTVAQDILKDPVNVDTHAWQDLDGGTALGMGPFYWSIVVLVVGMTGSIAVTTLVDGILGVVPVEMGPSFRKYRTVALSRLAAFFLKWGIMIASSAAAVGLMMLAAHLVNMPMPNGGLLFLISWLSICTISAATLGLLTVGGSAGLILSMIYLIFLGLPSAGAVVPVEALPDFFAWLSKIEPLHYTWLGVRDVLFFSAEPNAGLEQGTWGLFAIMGCSVLVVAVIAPLWDRLSGRRGLIHGTHNAHNVPSTPPETDGPGTAAQGGRLSA